MAEMVIQETRQHIPLLIIRPSVIESCSKEPFKGWIEGNRYETKTIFLKFFDIYSEKTSIISYRILICSTTSRMYDPVIISYGKGQLPAYLGDPHTPVDIVSMNGFLICSSINIGIFCFGT